MEAAKVISLKAGSSVGMSSLFNKKFFSKGWGLVSSGLCSLATFPFLTV